jgi:hypothetical protein
MPTVSEPILTVAPPARTRDGRRLAAALIIIGAVLVALVVVGFQLARSVDVSGQAQATQTGLQYSRTTMAWERGPTVAWSRLVRLGGLDAALQSVHLAGRHDVNTAALIHRYGKERQVDLVVLQGRFNTLPPDEGINVNGQVVVLVDMKTRHVILMTD